MNTANNKNANILKYSHKIGLLALSLNKAQNFEETDTLFVNIKGCLLESSVENM